MSPAAGADFLRLGLTGYPLGHSFSPRLHAAALAAAGLHGEYRLYPVAPGEEGARELEALAERLRSGELRGLNVTIPHKRAMMALADRLSETASVVGAVNTLVMREGTLWGENTDVPGFLHDLRAELAPRPGDALVLGAGGSARAVAYALAVEGYGLRIASRRQEQAEALAAEIGSRAGGRIRACGLDAQSLEQAAPQGCLIVNTTPLGMYPHMEGCPWPEGLPLPKGGAVYDLVYNPQETALVRRARHEGLPVASGLGMLVAQAALAFAHWTGLEPPFTAMHEEAKKMETL